MQCNRKRSQFRGWASIPFHYPFEHSLKHVQFHAWISNKKRCPFRHQSPSISHAFDFFGYGTSLNQSRRVTGECDDAFSCQLDPNGFLGSKTWCLYHFLVYWLFPKVYFIPWWWETQGLNATIFLHKTWPLTILTRYHILLCQQNAGIRSIISHLCSLKRRFGTSFFPSFFIILFHHEKKSWYLLSFTENCWE